jgi:Arc/MetJ family transcription regulator
MKITTRIDERLMREAMRATRSRTKREVLERGLARVLAEAKHREFARNLHRFKVNWTHDSLMRSRV